jgi:hypothetical protein
MVAQIDIPKFTPPKGKSYGRTGAGERHRPHRFIRLASIPIAAMLLLAGAGAVLLAFIKTFGSQAPINYSTIEILAARSWYAATSASQKSVVCVFCLWQFSCFTISDFIRPHSFDSLVCVSGVPRRRKNR